MYYKLTGFTQKLMVSAPVASLTMIFLLHLTQWCKNAEFTILYCTCQVMLYLYLSPVKSDMTNPGSYHNTSMLALFGSIVLL
uniref:Uncharacterized protein n=1 Tax=Pundamilia nyererei TaxID=303518 RepID=A0A3B4EWQ3_9CICH